MGCSGRSANTQRVVLLIETSVVCDINVEDRTLHLWAWVSVPYVLAYRSKSEPRQSSFCPTFTCHRPPKSRRNYLRACPDIGEIYLGAKSPPDEYINPPIPAPSFPDHIKSCMAALCLWNK